MRSRTMKPIISIIIFLVLIGIGLNVMGIVNGTPPRDYQFQIEHNIPINVEVGTIRLVAIGSPSHGNSEPYTVTLDVLKVMYENYGDVAFILEELVGDAEIINLNHSYYDSGKSENIGMYRIYGNKEMQQILSWLGKNGIRMYGIDIQDISAVSRILSEKMEALGFEDNESIANLPISLVAQIQGKLPQIDKIQSFILQCKLYGQLDDKEYTYLVHLLNCIRMNYDFIEEGRTPDSRDKKMAENVKWIMAYEKKYYSNDYAVILSHNGHVIKNKWNNIFNNETFTPMGEWLSKTFKDDYFVIVIDAEFNCFMAYTSTTSGKRRVFFTHNNNLFDLLGVFPQDSMYLRNITMERNIGTWDLTTIGSVYSGIPTWSHRFHSISLSSSEAWDAILYFEYMTPISPELNY